jgi:hypothetical protein
MWKCQNYSKCQFHFVAEMPPVVRNDEIDSLIKLNSNIKTT